MTWTLLVIYCTGIVKTCLWLCALPVVITPAVDHRHNWGHLALVGRVITFVRSLCGSFLWSYILWKYIGLRPKTASNFYAWILLTFLSWKVISLKNSLNCKKGRVFLMIFASLSTPFTSLSVISIWLEKITFFGWNLKALNLKATLHGCVLMGISFTALQSLTVFFVFDDSELDVRRSILHRRR